MKLRQLMVVTISLLGPNFAQLTQTDGTFLVAREKETDYI
jgi:hypothetical protein